MRNGTELCEAKPLVEVPRMDVAFDDGVELEDSEPVFLRLCKAVKDEFLADVPPPASRASERGLSPNPYLSHSYASFGPPSN